jgi:hypothetical protein
MSLALALVTLLAAVPAVPRLVVLTDIGGDTDDQQSMVRLLLHADGLDLEALCATSRMQHGHDTRPELLRELVGAYGPVLGNLRVHSPGFPPAERLLGAIRTGRGDPGPVGPGLDSECSEALVAALERDDPRPLWVAVWGGSRELAQALDRLRRDRSPATFGALISRLRVHAIGDQDGHRARIVQENPGLLFVASGLASQADFKLNEIAAYRGQYVTGNLRTQGREWVERNVRQGHGPLGALYPLDGHGVPGMKEGDTPSFLGLVPNGLNAPDRPDWGGWGGRFRLVRERLFGDAPDFLDGVVNERHSVSRWRDAFQREFAARLDWCVASRREEANHPPAPALAGPVERDVVPGESVALDGSESRDPDGDALDFRWWVYAEAGEGFPEPVAIEDADSPRARVHVPRPTRLRSIHVILEVTDGGRPSLTRYRRVVLRVDGSRPAGVGIGQGGPPRGEVQLDVTEGLGAHLVLATGREGDHPACVLEPVHLEHARERIDEPEVAQPLPGVERHLADAVDVDGRRRSDLAGPVRNELPVGRGGQNGHPLQPPAREVRYDDLLPEVELRLEENPPAPRAAAPPAGPLERTQISRQDRGGEGVGERRTGRRVELPVEDFAHEVIGQGLDVGVGRWTAQPERVCGHEASLHRDRARRPSCPTVPAPARVPHPARI